MDESNLNRLYELAKAKRKPVGTMAREWIVEKLDSESGPLDMGSPANLKKALEQIMILLDQETKRRTLGTTTGVNVPPVFEYRD